jgi:hypothetical protein
MNDVPKASMKHWNHMKWTRTKGLLLLPRLIVLIRIAGCKWDQLFPDISIAKNSTHNGMTNCYVKDVVKNGARSHGWTSDYLVSYL